MVDGVTFWAVMGSWIFLSVDVVVVDLDLGSWFDKSAAALLLKVLMARGTTM